MRSKNKPRKDRRTTTPSDRRNKANEEGQAEKATGRLLATLYRKGKDPGILVVRLSEFSLHRLSIDETSISRAECKAELRRLVLDILDRDGVVNHRVIRRKEDRLRIIRTVLERSVEVDEVEMFPSSRDVTYRLSAHQMKKQAKACKEHDARIQSQREERRQVKQLKRGLSESRAI